MQLIKEINISFKTSRKSFTNLNNIKKYSLLLEEHFEKCTTKIMDLKVNANIDTATSWLKRKFMCTYK